MLEFKRNLVKYIVIVIENVITKEEREKLKKMYV